MTVFHTVEQNVIYTNVRGAVGFEDARAHLARLMADERIPEDMIEVIVLDESAQPSFSSQEAGAIGSMAIALISRKRTAKTVVVAGTAIQYGVARMLGMRLMSANPNLDWHEVRTVEEAVSLVRQWKEEIQALREQNPSPSPDVSVETGTGTL